MHPLRPVVTPHISTRRRACRRRRLRHSRGDLLDPPRRLRGGPSAGVRDGRGRAADAPRGAARATPGPAPPWPDWTAPELVEAWRSPRDRRAVVAPGGGGRGRPARRARRAVDRHRVRQVARLPDAGAHHDPGVPRPARAGAARRCSTCRPPRPSPRTSCRRCCRSACPGSPPPRTTATRRASSATSPATTASTSSPTPTCCTARCCPAMPAGPGSSASLSYVVVDECHHYRGVFGAHVAQILRRLRRVAASYGAHPTFVLASATVAEPEVSARAADRPAGDRGRRRRVRPRPGVPRTVGAAVHLLRRRERRPRTPFRGGRGRRPAGRPRRRAGPHAGLRPVAARRRDGVADHQAAARRGRRRGCPTGSRPTAAATSPRTAASSSGACATASCSASRRPTRSSSASTSPGSTRC